MAPPANMPPPANDAGSADLSYWNADGAYFAAQAEKYMWLAVEAAEARLDKLEKLILRERLNVVDGDKPWPIGFLLKPPTMRVAVRHCPVQPSMGPKRGQDVQ